MGLLKGSLNEEKKARTQDRVVRIVVERKQSRLVLQKITEVKAAKVKSLQKVSKAARIRILTNLLKAIKIKTKEILEIVRNRVVIIGVGLRQGKLVN